MQLHSLSGISEKERNQSPDQIQEVTEKGFIRQFAVRQTGVVNSEQGCGGQFQFVVVRQAWVRSGQTKAWFQGAG